MGGNLQRGQEKPFKERFFPAPSALPHLFPNLFKLRFIFLSGAQKNKADEKFENRPKFSASSTDHALGYVLAGCAWVLILLAALMPLGGFWITDGGNKAMVMENFQTYRSIAMRNPAAALDPANRFFPDAVFHFQRVGKAIYSVFPPYFPVLTAPLYQAFGPFGMILLPLAGAFLSLALTAGLMRRWRLRAPWLVAAACVATPLVFYAVEFWEMTLGVAAVAAMFFLLDRKSDLAAGLALALGLWFRPEMFFFAVIAGVVLLIADRRRAVRFGAGFLAGAAVYGLVQFLLFGSVLGIHGTTYAHTARRFFWNYYYYWFSCAPAELVLGAAALAQGCFPRFRSFARGKLALAFAAAVWSGFRLARMLSFPEPVTGTIFSVGFFTTTPFVYWLAANWRPLWNAPVRKVRPAVRIAFLYTLVLPPLLTSSDLGIIWGARHGLFLMPLFVFLAWYAARSRAARAAVCGLFLFSMFFQWYGICLQRQMRARSLELADFLRKNTEDVIVSDVFFLPMQTPKLFRERRWLFVKDDRELLDAVELLRAKRQPFALVRSANPEYRRYGNDAVRGLLEKIRVTEPPRRVRLPGTAFLECEVFRIREFR